MNNDLDIIHKTFPHEWEHLNVYAIGDVHVGSPNFNETAIHEKLRIIEEHEYEICPPPELQYLELRAYRDNDRNRTLTRVMNYHTVQI